MRDAREAGLATTPFLNHGTLAGATQPHPHAQLLALPTPAAPLLAERDWLRDPDNCPLCGPAAGTVIVETATLRAVAPQVPAHAGEILIAPQGHDGLFDAAPSHQVTELARLLQIVGEAVRGVWGACAYNVLWHQAPSEPSSGRNGPGPAGFHWHLHLVPRTYIPSILEREWPLTVGSGTEAAARLRANLL